MAPRKPKGPALTDLDQAVITHGAQGNSAAVTEETDHIGVMSTEQTETIRQVGGAEITGQQLAAESSFSQDPDADARDAAQIAARDQAEEAAAQERTTDE